MGRVATDAAAFWSRVRRGAPGDCWEWQLSLDKDGYGRVSVRDRGRRAHRFAWELAHGREPIGVVLHTCDNPPCVNPAHLREGTHLDNVRDKVAKGRLPDQSGERAPGAKLTWADVDNIRSLHLMSDPVFGWTLQALAEHFDVAVGTISDAIKDRTWIAA